jgi:formylglycine-generating enzyme
MKMTGIWIVVCLFVIALTSCTASKTVVEEYSPSTEAILIDEVRIEGGTFKMGDTGDNENPDGRPRHHVTLDDYYLSTCEITQDIYEQVMQTNPSQYRQKDLPVTSVTWYEAVAFCNRLSERNGLQRVYGITDRNVTADFSRNGYRLPTEAEWEYAARSRGREDRPWSGTDREEAIPDFAWYYWDDEHAHPVAQKKPNELGLYDMTGNAEEWCWDWYGAYTAASKKNPLGQSSGVYRVARGGAWNWDALYSRTLRRDGFTPEKHYDIMGFRIARKAM